MQAALNKVNMNLGSEDGSLLQYTGSEFLITDEMAQIGQTLWNIGNRFPYRTTNDPIIFSSKPGARSVFRKNPNSYFSLKLAPLASRIARYQNLTETNSELPLSVMISALPDFKSGVGEISLTGSVTWSELTNMQQTLAQVKPRWKIFSE